MIQGKILRDAMISASNSLAQKKQSVDELNVFPVPDGDTGTNMSMTLANAARELSRLTDPTVGEVADTASAALLRGARGNSGVILSLLFRGFSKGLKGRAEADGSDLANALTLGVEAAYKAVMKPTEGTILTVAREAAEKGREKASEENASPQEVWAAICDEAEASLQRTPELLPVLKKAGVVDAGGQGFCLILRAMQHVLEGGEMVQSDQAAAPTAPAQRVSAAGAFETDIRFTYCTEFIVGREKGNDRDPLLLRAFLETIGDCVVVVDDEEIVKVHVHTNDPGRALQEGQLYGQFETVKVENMRIQHQNAAWVPEEAEGPAPLERVEPEKDYGFVSVAAGEGLKALFADLGCDQVVSGGQTMNPSTDDILNAIEATPAKTVFVLPNNKNIILAAEQAIPLADRKVHVLSTRTIPQGITAMLNFDADADAEQNLLEMMKAADNVSTAQVTFAARNSNVGGQEIKEGQILSLENGKVVGTDTDIHHATVKLVKNIVNTRRLTGKSVDFITIIYGEGMTEADAEQVRDSLQAKYDGVDITMINGGQPVYYYIISIE